MSASQEPAARPEPPRVHGRLVTVAAIISGLAFLALWLMAFSAITSLLAALACCALLIAASALSDPFEMVLEAISSIILGVLGIVVAIVVSLFSIFD